MEDRQDILGRRKVTSLAEELSGAELNACGAVTTPRPCWLVGVG